MDAHRVVGKKKFIKFRGDLWPPAKTDNSSEKRPGGELTTYTTGEVTTSQYEEAIRGLVMVDGQRNLLLSVNILLDFSTLINWIKKY